MQNNNNLPIVKLIHRSFLLVRLLKDKESLNDELSEISNNTLL